jgi:hypothetical protein
MSRFASDNYDDIERAFDVLSSEATQESESWGDPMPNNDELWQRAYDRVVNEAIGSWEWRG